MKNYVQHDPKAPPQRLTSLYRPSVPGTPLYRMDDKRHAFRRCHPRTSSTAKGPTPKPAPAPASKSITIYQLPTLQIVKSRNPVHHSSGDPLPKPVTKLTPVNFYSQRTSSDCRSRDCVDHAFLPSDEHERVWRRKPELLRCGDVIARGELVSRCRVDLRRRRSPQSDEVTVSSWRARRPRSIELWGARSRAGTIACEWERACAARIMASR